MTNYTAQCSTPSDSMKDWILWETLKGYSVWCRQCGWQTVWNITKGEKPSASSGGYFDRKYLLTIKGLL